MRKKITRATLTPYNEHGVSSKTHSTNANLTHAYLARAAEMNFRKPDFHAHWWSYDVAPICLPQPGYASFFFLFFKQCQNWELIWWSGNSLEKGDNELSQLWISTSQFSTSPFATQSAKGPGRLTWAASEWWWVSCRKRLEGLLPLIQDSKVKEKH